MKDGETMSPSEAAVATAIATKGQEVGGRGSLATQPKCEGGKVGRRASRLMKWILLNAGDGLERGEVVAGYFGLERRYRGYWTDPCLRGRARRQYERRYRSAQPTVTRTLARLERYGLVELIKRGKVVKEIRLTATGRAIAQALTEGGTI